MQLNNRVVMSAAGSGKTTFLIDEASRDEKKKIVILTYTIHNYNEIKKKFIELLGFIPSHVKIQTWYSFLLTECVRPYQNFVYDKSRIESIFFREKPLQRWIKRDDINRYYFNNSNQIDRDKLSDFAYRCNQSAKGLVIERLEDMYDYIYIDEIQDMAGYDLELIKLFFKSRLNVVLVGDARQATYTTNNSLKNKKYKGKGIIDFFEEQEKNGNCSIEYRNICFRCNQSICDFADLLYLELPKTESANLETTGHDGVFFIKKRDFQKYIDVYNPQILRHNARTKVDNAINFGVSKGLTFDRVLVMPTKAVKDYLKTGNLEHVSSPITKSKLYVAITRAKYSVTFVVDEPVSVGNIEEFQFNNQPSASKDFVVN
ncbi:UvrD-helicase domain-containing protein [Bacillus wiedmannii]|uniref:UvrD-helicase domain-containing protein n=1 Tax=Bacillus wiedmannii TaxID=1890302 RepID=UPI000BFE6C8D|nr:UvrD-helicase domain-containing protein [Bacillus wiedmannii]PHG45978.1 DNA helicase II [Bacillus wiedmannii]